MKTNRTQLARVGQALSTVRGACTLISDARALHQCTEGLRLQLAVRLRSLRDEEAALAALFFEMSKEAEAAHV